MPRPLLQHQPVDPTCIGPKIQHRPSPPYYDPYVRPPPKPPDIIDPLDSRKDLLENDLDRKVEIEENSPFQEGIISEIYERPDTSYVQEPQELKDLIDTTKLIQKFLPKQTDIDKILDIIKRKVLKGTHLPLTIKEIQTGYLSSPYFKDLYLFLSPEQITKQNIHYSSGSISRSIPFFPVSTVEIASTSQMMVIVEAPFTKELSGMAMVKILDMKEQTTNMIKLKFIQNKVVLKITNKTHKTVTFGRTKMMGILDLRSLGFYKIKQEVLQEHLGRLYHFKLADDVCDQYNRFVNLMRKEEENSENKFLWLDDTDERKYMTGREILDKYVNLDNSCLTKIEKEQVRYLLYQYKDAFSLRDEIGLCPNIEIEIDVTDKSLFFIRPFHANEEDKVIFRQRNEVTVLFGYTKGGLLSLFQPSNVDW